MLYILLKLLIKGGFDTILLTLRMLVQEQLNTLMFQAILYVVH